MYKFISKNVDKFQKRLVMEFTILHLIQNRDTKLQQKVKKQY